MIQSQKPHIVWDVGSAYDLFASLHVLHHPEKFGLRASWAAGVRSRLAPAQRTILEQAERLLFISPVAWVGNLPLPHDAATVLRHLGELPLSMRLPTLAFHHDVPPALLKMLNEVSSSRSWNDADLKRFQVYYQRRQAISSQDAASILNWWSHPGEFGDLYLEALQTYVEVFYAEEERRIQPYLLQAVEKAQALAAQYDFPHLMQELSRGVKIASLEESQQVIFAPSYWITPLVMYDSVKPEQWLVLFGARPAEVALVPGEVVPDAMLKALKALSDPTRLLILRYLSDQPHSPAQLARKLRLRPPTVIHHLNALRLAGLVNISLNDGEEKHYTVRSSVVGETFIALQGFLSLRGEE